MSDCIKGASGRGGGGAGGSDDRALGYESWGKTRASKSWSLRPGQPSEDKKLLFDRWALTVHPPWAPSSMILHVNAEIAHMTLERKEEGCPPMHPRKSL